MSKAVISCHKGRNSALTTDRQTDRQTERKVHLLGCASQLKRKKKVMEFSKRGGPSDLGSDIYFGRKILEIVTKLPMILSKIPSP